MSCSCTPPRVRAAAPIFGLPNPRLTPVNYGNIVLTASNWPFLIAEQEGLFQKEGIDFKRVIGGNTTATTQALVAGSTDFAQMNLVNLLAANSAGADLIVIGGDSPRTGKSSAYRKCHHRWTA